MPRLEICNCDLHWQWINWTILCDTMEVSMVRLASLAIAQHVFQPALTGRPESGPELISRKIVSREREQRLYRGEQISRKNVSRELGPTSYRDFAKNIALMGAKKWGPTCDRDISNSAIYTTAIYRAYTVPPLSGVRCQNRYPGSSSSCKGLLPYSLPPLLPWSQWSPSVWKSRPLLVPSTQPSPYHLDMPPSRNRETSWYKRWHW